ncbi:hypothetical protein R6Q57_005468 [Mikania cordata]
MALPYWSIRELGTSFEYDELYDVVVFTQDTGVFTQDGGVVTQKDVEEQVDACNVDDEDGKLGDDEEGELGADEEGELGDDEEGNDISDYILMENEYDDSDFLFDHEMETDEDDDYMHFVDQDIDEGDGEQDIEVDLQGFENDFDLDINDFDSLTDEENDNPLKRSLRKERRKKKKKRDVVNEPFFVGQCFHSRDEIRDLVKKLAAESRRQLRICRNDPQIFRVNCDGTNVEFSGGTTEGNLVMVPKVL